MKSFYLLIFLLVSCSSVIPTKKSSYNVPIALPGELKEKFTVQEQIDSNKLDPNKDKEEKTNKDKKNINIKKVKKEKVLAIPTEVITPTILPFQIGEKINYNISYIGIHAGTLSLEVSSKKVINHKEVYHFKANVYSAAFFAKVFKVNLLIESFIEPLKFESYRYQVTGDEGNLSKQNLELYDYDNLTVYEWKREEKNEEFTETKNTYKNLKPLSKDLLGSLYYLRTLDFSKNPSYQFQTINGNKIKNNKISYLKNENIKINDKQYSCNVISLTIEGMTNPQIFWITADSAKTIVKIDSKIKWGNFTVEIDN